MENKEEMIKTELNEEALDSIVGGYANPKPRDTPYQADHKITHAQETRLNNLREIAMEHVRKGYNLYGQPYVGGYSE